MSKIVVAIGRPLAPATLAEVGKITGASLSALQRNIRDRKPVLIQELFLNDHEVAASRLRQLLDLAKRDGISLSIFELKPDEAYETVPPGECQIDAPTLVNILIEWERRRDRM